MLSRKLSVAGALCLLTAFVIGLIGCGGNSTFLGPGSNTVSNVRVFNGLIGSNANGANGINVRLRQASTTSVNVTPVVYNAASANHQTSSGDGQNTYLFLSNSQTPIATQSLDFAPNDITANTTGQLLIATGVVGQTGIGIQPQILRVPTSVPIALIRTNGNPNSNALLRVVNAAPGTNGITLYNEQGPVPFTDLSNITFGNYSSGGQTSSNYATLTAGSYNITVRDSQSGGILVNSLNVTLQPGDAYTLVVLGSPVSVYSTPVTVALLQDYPLQ
jgi:hypothetical protein